MDVFHHGVRDEGNLWIVAGAVEHDFRGAETFAPVNDRDPARKASKEIRLFHRGIAAAYDRNFFAREKESVAGRARAYAMSDELLLMRQSEPLR